MVPRFVSIDMMWYKSIKFENLADNIVEYLIHMLNETFLQTDLYLDCNDYDIL